MAARTEYEQAYYNLDPEKHRKRARDWYAENKETIDKEKKKAYMKEYLKTYQRKEMTPEQREERNRKNRERYANDPEYREKVKAASRTTPSHTPERRKPSRLKESFGMTMEQFQGMQEAQDGKCAICGMKATGSKRTEHLFVDHCHTTGTIRGLLCNNCNFGLGHFKDNPELLIKAADYLTKLSSGAILTTNRS